MRAATAERPQRDGTSPDVAMRLLQAAMPLPRLVFGQTDTESETGDEGGVGQQQQQQPAVHDVVWADGAAESLSAG